MNEDKQTSISTKEDETNPNKYANFREPEDMKKLGVSKKDEKHWIPSKMKEQKQMLEQLGLNGDKLTRNAAVFLVFDGITEWNQYLENAITEKDEYVLRGELSSNVSLRVIVFAALRIMDDLKQKAKANGDSAPTKPNKKQQIDLILKKIRSCRAKLKSRK